MIYLGQECGRQFLNEEASRRIVGGRACIVSRWPWQVALIANGEQVCGGSLVTPDWIVTAAHCVHKTPDPSAYTVVVGM